VDNDDQFEADEIGRACLRSVKHTVHYSRTKLSLERDQGRVVLDTKMSFRFQWKEDIFLSR